PPPGHTLREAGHAVSRHAQARDDRAAHATLLVKHSLALPPTPRTQLRGLIEARTRTPRSRACGGTPRTQLRGLIEALVRHSARPHAVPRLRGLSFRGLIEAVAPAPLG